MVTPVTPVSLLLYELYVDDNNVSMRYGIVRLKREFDSASRSSSRPALVPVASCYTFFTMLMRRSIGFSGNLSF
ncbi:MAG: hypothetical protein IT320_18990 [Anaerolineae bacterium]|nr:hypothetical protein [Anaerolineae bacterium]